MGVFAPPPEWGAFQQHSVEQFLQRPELLGPQGNYGMVGPLGAEAAHTLPLEGPSTSWQGAFMLPPHGDSPPTTANEGSISPAFPWSRITPLPFQGLRPVSSFGVAGAQAGPGVPAAMAMPNPALSGGVPTNENQHIWGNAGHHHPVPAKEDGKLKRRFDDAGLLRAQSPEISHAMKREKLLPNEGKLRVSASRAHAEHSNASSSKTQRSAAVAKELAGSRGQQGSASSSSVQAAGNLGRDADADSPSTQPGAKAEGVPSRHPFYRLPKLQDGADLNVAKFFGRKSLFIKDKY